jgi:hypothetical protein
VLVKLVRIAAVRPLRELPTNKEFLGFSTIRFISRSETLLSGDHSRSLPHPTCIGKTGFRYRSPKDQENPYRKAHETRGRTTATRSTARCRARQVATQFLVSMTADSEFTPIREKAAMSKRHPTLALWKKQMSFGESRTFDNFFERYRMF